jgi:hypothetical protein
MNTTQKTGKQNKLYKDRKTIHRKRREIKTDKIALRRRNQKKMREKLCVNYTYLSKRDIEIIGGVILGQEMNPKSPLSSLI